MKKKIKINIWNFIEIDDLNEWLDEELEHKFVPTDIGYKIIKIKKNGELEFEAEFKKGLEVE